LAQSILSTYFKETFFYHSAPVELNSSKRALNEESNSVQFHIYPNPTSKDIQIHLNSKLQTKNQYQFQILDMYGKVLKEFEVDSQKLFLEVNDLKQGVYFGRLLENGLPVGTQKISILR